MTQVKDDEAGIPIGLILIIVVMCSFLVAMFPLLAILILNNETSLENAAYEEISVEAIASGFIGINLHSGTIRFRDGGKVVESRIPEKYRKDLYPMAVYGFRYSSSRDRVTIYEDPEQHNINENVKLAYIIKAINTSSLIIEELKDREDEAIKFLQDRDIPLVE